MVEKKDVLSMALDKRGENDWILVRVDPTSKMSMISMRYLFCTVVITRKDSSTVQRCGMSRDWSVPGDDIVPEGTSYVCTVKILWPRLSESMVQIDPPFDDHTTEVVQASYLISLATPPVWIS